ncbi:hypothetical protein SVAN01_09614 [Stagonosporopsis vannaccii]|nr:hypothetical protein SVAN01_09614 [Stagonosporopsis vannaccii]
MQNTAAIAVVIDTAQSGKRDVTLLNWERHDNMRAVNAWRRNPLQYLLHRDNRVHDAVIVTQPIQQPARRIAIDRYSLRYRLQGADIECDVKTISEILRYGPKAVAQVLPPPAEPKKPQAHSRFMASGLYQKETCRLKRRSQRVLDRFLEVTSVSARGMPRGTELWPAADATFATSSKRSTAFSSIRLDSFEDRRRCGCDLARVPRTWQLRCGFRIASFCDSHGISLIGWKLSAFACVRTPATLPSRWSKGLGVRAAVASDQVVQGELAKIAQSEVYRSAAGTTTDLPSTRSKSPHLKRLSGRFPFEDLSEMPAHLLWIYLTTWCSDVVIGSMILYYDVTDVAVERMPRLDLPTSHYNFACPRDPVQPSHSGQRHNLGAEVGVKLSHMVEEPNELAAAWSIIMLMVLRDRTKANGRARVTHSHLPHANRPMPPRKLGVLALDVKRPELKVASTTTRKRGCRVVPNLLFAPKGDNVPRGAAEAPRVVAVAASGVKRNVWVCVSSD